MTIGIDFTPRHDPPWWQTVLAWLVLIALFFGFLRCCVQPAMRPFTTALKEMK